MGNIKTAMRGVVLMGLWLAVTAYVVTIEVTRVTYFSVTAYAQPALSV